MANLPLSHRLQPLVRLDGDWLRCAEPNCGDRAYWGRFRPTDFVLAKVQAHRAKVHGAAGRPQRRNAAARAVAIEPAALAALAAAAVELARTQPRLGQGVARTVVALGPDFVAKLAGGRILAASEGAKHNLAEWRDYHAADASVQPWLCPPVLCAPDGAWLIARRASDVGHMPWSAYERVLSAIGHRVNDLHRQNVGMLDGRPVAVDYGFGIDGSVRL